jgi:hypothetical protein
MIQDHFLQCKYKIISSIANTRLSPSLQRQNHLLHYKYKTISFITNTRPSPPGFIFVIEGEGFVFVMKEKVLYLQ